MVQQSKRLINIQIQAERIRTLRAKIIDTFLQNVFPDPRIIRTLLQHFVAGFDGVGVRFRFQTTVTQFVANRQFRFSAAFPGLSVSHSGFTVILILFSDVA